MKNKTTKQQADAAATAKRDAYSRNRYTDASWVRIARLMADAGFTPAQIEAVLDSKHMRWAADAANRSHSATAADFMRYITTNYGGLNAPKFALTLPELRQPEHFAAGADLAGNCEGEDIAELIDFVTAHARTGNKHAQAIIARIAGRK